MIWARAADAQEPAWHATTSPDMPIDTFDTACGLTGLRLRMACSVLAHVTAVDPGPYVEVCDACIEKSGDAPPDGPV